MKQIRQPIFYLQWILICFSMTAFKFANVEVFKLQFDISSIGFQT